MQTSRNPRVTVLMPMRDAAQFLRAAMQSILTQTEGDVEFLVIDDGSGDDSLEIASSLADDRTRIVADGRHLGLVARLNQGLDMANTEFVARMDADDIAVRQRLARQLAYMDANPDVTICGSWYTAFRGERTVWRARLPENHERLRALSLFASPFAHPTVMIRRRPFDAAGLRYDDAMETAEDYDLWERAGARVRLANVPEFLLSYRVHGSQVSAMHRERQRTVSDRVRRRALERYGIDFDDEDLALQSDIAFQTGMDDPDRARAALRWLERLQTEAVARGDAALVAECKDRARFPRKRLRKAIVRRFRRRLLPRR